MGRTVRLANEFFNIARMCRLGQHTFCKRASAPSLARSSAKLKKTSLSTDGSKGLAKVTALRATCLRGQIRAH